MPLREFPKRVTLRDHTVVIVRPMRPEDARELLAFFRRLPPEDRQFLKDDVTRAEIIDAWARELNYDQVLPILAEHEGQIVGDATLHRQTYGWMRHVGEIRVVTDVYYRRRGLALAVPVAAAGDQAQGQDQTGAPENGHGYLEDPNRFNKPILIW